MGGDAEDGMSEEIRAAYEVFLHEQVRRPGAEFMKLFRP
jgi:hypothetical protein